MNVVEHKFVGILSTRLTRFKVKATKPYKANVRCPLCGDSQQSTSKARGWFTERAGTVFFTCFNCGASHPLWRFLKVYDTNLYNEYVVDSTFEKHLQRPDTPKPEAIDKITEPVASFRKAGSPLLQIKKISQLKADHPARLYVDRRRIPVDQHHRLYYAPKFNQWINSILPGKLPERHDTNPRLILPFIDDDGELFGLAGRAFDKSSLRYITIMLNDQPKIFGLNCVDFSKPYFVTEGPIDSLFLSNAVAMAGADGNAEGLKNLANATFVFDAEPRNKEIVKRMEGLIDRGYKVAIWPSTFSQYGKDINEYVLAGIAPKVVEATIIANTHDGLEGRLALTAWRKC